MTAVSLHPRGGRILPDLTPPPIASSRPGSASRDDIIRALFEAGLSDEEIAEAVNVGVPTVRLRRSALRLMRRQRHGAAPKAMSRHAPRSIDGEVARMPPVDNPALVERRTLYPSSVVPVAGTLNLLVAGVNAWKIGSAVTKGRWRGFPIFTLTLQERATCPTSCGHWRSCYGNGMNWAKRIVHGPALEDRLALEVGLLASRHPAGFAVRLHVLGDFYSVGYVALWRGLIERFPNLHVFGFTARIDRDDPITRALVHLVEAHWPRCALRFSNAPIDSHSTVSIEHPLQKPADAIVCPQQTGRTASCGTCGLCWATTKPIAFLRH